MDREWGNRQRMSKWKENEEINRDSRRGTKTVRKSEMTPQMTPAGCHMTGEEFSPTTYSSQGRVWRVIRKSRRTIGTQTLRQSFPSARAVQRQRDYLDTQNVIIIRVRPKNCGLLCKQNRLKVPDFAKANVKHWVRLIVSKFTCREGPALPKSNISLKQKYLPRLGGARIQSPHSSTSLLCACACALVWSSTYTNHPILLLPSSE